MKKFNNNSFDEEVNLIVETVKDDIKEGYINSFSELHDAIIEIVDSRVASSELDCYKLLHQVKKIYNLNDLDIDINQYSDIDTLVEGYCFFGLYEEATRKVFELNLDL